MLSFFENDVLVMRLATGKLVTQAISMKLLPSLPHTTVLKRGGFKSSKYVGILFILLCLFSRTLVERFIYPHAVLLKHMFLAIRLSTWLIFPQLPLYKICILFIP